MASLLPTVTSKRKQDIRCMDSCTVGSRGSLLLARRSLAEPARVEEAVEAAKQQATVTNLKRRLADTGGVTFFEWPLWLGPHPPTAAAQAKALQDW
eukprot:6105973-Amphidinium_carterae.1